mmetsp:Transcript_27452/g.20610  ORF Transcript_27452/g.20610 Transcript_27452/m.20610 type:complete len:87 (+) Transcript_27452:253-513(+)
MKRYLVVSSQTTVDTNVRGASLGSMVPTENRYTAKNDHPQIHATQNMANTNGTRKTYGVDPMNWAVHFKIAMPSLMREQRQRRMRK